MNEGRAPGRRWRWLVVLGLLSVAAGGMGAAATWWVKDRSGHTPQELVAYAQRRLQGHPKLEWVFNPLWAQLLRWTGASAEPPPFQVPSLGRNPMVLDPPQRVSGAGKVIRVGPGRAVTRIGVAARLAVDGSIIELDPGDYVADVALWDRAELTIRGTGRDVRLIAAGASMEGKAIWVVRRGRVTIEGVDFIGAKVPDRNGAGIRLEGGHLTVRRCRFIGNENGILTASGPGTILEVENSEFGYNGAGDGLSHGVYAGAIRKLRLTGNYFHHANVGHLVKSRARENRVEFNRMTDEVGGQASYELDFPNGGVAEVVGNVVQQGSGTRNSTVVAFGVEGYRWPQNLLVLAHNTVVNDHPWGGRFLRFAPGSASVVSRNNLLVGRGQWPVVTDSAGDLRVDWGVFAQASRHDYRPRESAWAGLAADSLAPLPEGLALTSTYEHPRTTAPLRAPPRWVGALQASVP